VAVLGNKVFIEHNGNRMQLAINPAELTLNYVGDNTTMSIVEAREINIIGRKNLVEVSFEGFFPNGSGGAEGIKDGIEAIIDESDTCRFIVTKTNINLLVTVESFDETRKHSNGDIYYSISMKEYRPHPLRAVAAPPPAPRAPSAPPAPPPAPPPKRVCGCR